MAHMVTEGAAILEYTEAGTTPVITTGTQVSTTVTATTFTIRPAITTFTEPVTGTYTLITKGTESKHRRQEKPA